VNGAPLGALAAQAARRFARRSCLVHGVRRWSFAEVDAIVDALARSLLQRLAPGARVGLFMSNRPEFVFLQLALERAGLARVPLNARATAHEIGVVLEDCSTSALFFDTTTCEATTAVARRPDFAPIWFCQVDADAASNGPRWSELVPGTDGPRVTRTVDADDVCSINYTSGTSGKPKGVVLTHRNWAAMYRNMLVDRDMRADDVFVHVGPLTHSSGAYFLAWFLRGACNVLVDGAGVDAMLQTMARERATVFTCVPTVLTRIVNHPDLDRYDLSSIRAIGYGAEPIPFNTLEKTIARFGPIVTQNYGLTEAMMTVTLLRPDEHFTAARTLRVGCIGRPYSFVEVVLRARDGTEVGPGEVGEITIRSEHMMERYWERPEETAKALRDGWLWSGDLATRDAEGFITLAGRSKEMLISGGFNIYPAEIEALLTSHPAVLEAAVVGVPDATWGEVAIAYVSPVPDSALDRDALQAHCKPILGFKTPKAFHLVDQLPKNANGKIDKPALKAAAGQAREVPGRG
jgi:acyl-CoA synthetase (AMP-forming)/AMP-acid ligase II